MKVIKIQNDQKANEKRNLSVNKIKNKTILFIKKTLTAIFYIFI